MLAVSLSGCFASSTLTLRREAVSSSIRLKDERPDAEGRTKSVNRYSAYIGDDRFVPNKMAWLAWRIEQEFPELSGKTVTVKHFYFLNELGKSGAASFGAPLAAISMPIAIVANATAHATQPKRAADVHEVGIEIEIDGATYRGSKATPFVMREVMYSTENNNAAVLDALEGAFAELAQRIRARDAEP